MQPIPDKAKISLDFPDKTYLGAFGRDSQFEVGIEPDGFLLKFVHGGPQKRLFELHVHPRLMADIMSALAEALQQHPITEAHERDQLRNGIIAIQQALG